MKKNTIKKIILTIIIISVLIISLVFFFKISSEDYKDDISIVKKIIREKYKDIIYFENSSYICAYSNDYTCDVYDYNGNKIYSFYNNKKSTITYVSKDYYIIHDGDYHLYDKNSKELFCGNNIYGINDYLVFADNNIINSNGEKIFKNIKKIKSYYEDKYYILDSYFVSEKGKVLLNNYNIVKEKINDNSIDYIIIEKNKKYYCFFPLVDKIIGDSFDKFFEYNNDTYIVSNNKIYRLYDNGLRKEIKFTINKNIFSVDYKNAVNKNKILAIKDYYLGLLETDTNKFHRIVKTKDFSFKYLDDDNINIYCNNINYVYNIKNYEIIYKNNFDEIVIFDNNYKTIKINNKYYLLDDQDRRVTFSDKQIILLNSKVKIGKVEKDIVLFDSSLHYGEKIIINGEDYYKYSIDNYKYIVSSDLKKEYKSNLYLNYMDETIVKMDKNKIYFYNPNNKIYSYNLSDYRIKNKEINKNEIILSNKKNIIILNKKGKIIKRINNTKLENIYYNESKKAIFVVVKNNSYKGVYVLK